MFKIFEWVLTILSIEKLIVLRDKSKGRLREAANLEIISRTYDFHEHPL